MLEIPISDVSDDEILYRRILDGFDLYEVVRRESRASNCSL